MRNSKSSEIRAIYSSMKDKRIKFYQNMIKEFDEYDEFSMRIERVLAYQILLRKSREDSEFFKKKVFTEIEMLQNEENRIN